MLRQQAAFLAPWVGVVLATSAQAEAAGTNDSSSARDPLRLINNPVANVISLPLESTWDVDADGDVRYTLELVPVIPARVSDDWLVVSRLELPSIANGPLPGDGHSGLGDAELSVFLSPEYELHGWEWGLGPILLLPTAGDALGDDRWGAGPTAVVLLQRGGWTAGVRVSHEWSFAGAGSEDVSRTLLDPWLNRSWDDSGFGWDLEVEATYDWDASQGTLPLQMGVSQLVTRGDQTSVELELGALYYAARASGDARWGMTFNATLSVTE